MVSHLEWFISKRYLTSSNKEGFVSVISWFSFIGIALGVATLIIVMSVMNGFREELLTRLIGMRGHIIIQENISFMNNYESLVKKISSNKDVRLTLPIIERQGVVLAHNLAHGVMIRGIDPISIPQYDLLRDSLQNYSVDAFVSESVFIGKKLATKLRVSVGDSITLIIPETHVTAFGSLPKQKRLIVRDIFEVGMNDFDKNMILIPLKSAQKIFKMPEQIDYIEVFGKQMNQAEKLCAQFQKELGNNYLVKEWQFKDSQVLHAVNVQRNVMFLILILIILVASFNIISGLIILVKDKTRDIAILRTMGMTRYSIMQIFLFVGSSIGIGGTLLGTTLGLVVSLNIENIRQALQKLLGTELFDSEIYFLTQLPSKTDWHDVIFICGMSLVLSFLATLYPSWRAGQQDPIKGIQ
jgi:lipoprotein-releasing system permease protein